MTIENLSEMHQQQGKCALLMPQQEGWLRIERMMADINLKVCNWHNADNPAKRRFMLLHVASRYAVCTHCIKPLTSTAAAPCMQVTHLPPKQRWRVAVFWVVQSAQFEMAAMAAIIANCLVMAMTHVDMNAAWQDFMTWANTGFTVFFTLEILAKFVALGFKAVLRVRVQDCSLLHTLALRSDRQAAACVDGFNNPETV